MSPAQEQSLDEAILRVLDEKDNRFGLGISAIGHLIVAYGFSNTAHADIQRRLDYLSDEQIAFTRQVDKGNFNSAVHTWRVTAKGTNHLREQGI